MANAGVTAFFDPTKSFDENVDKGPFPSSIELPYENTGEPTYEFLGKKVHLPFGIPAGPLPSSKHIQYGFERGFDVLTYKTQRTVEFQSNEFPNIVYLDVEGDLTLERASQPLVGYFSPMVAPDQLTITNSFGNPSRGTDFWVQDMAKAARYKGEGQFLIGSVVGTIQEGFSSADYYADFAKAAGLAASTGVDAVEVNLSCPNVANEGIICYTRDAVVDICRQAKAAIGDLPLIAKVGYYTPQQQELLETIIADVAEYVSAFAAINTLQGAIVDEKGEQLLKGEGRLKSGICGAGVKWAGLEMTRRLDAIRKDKGYTYEIIGVGGVMKPEDYQEYMAAGANCVQSATGAMWNPNLAIEIKEAVGKKSF